MCLMAGAMKATQPREKLLKQRPWTENFSTGRVRFIGVVELLAAIGLILPAASGIAVLFDTAGSGRSGRDDAAGGTDSHPPS
jgi:DoxX-like family